MGAVPSGTDRRGLPRIPAVRRKKKGRGTWAVGGGVGLGKIGLGWASRWKKKMEMAATVREKGDGCTLSPKLFFFILN
jgi:hypothetical protein